MTKRSAIFFTILIAALSANARATGFRAINFNYNIAVKNIPLGISSLEVWVPAPREADHQRVEDISKESSWPYSVTFDKKHRNKIVYYDIKNPKKSEIRITRRYRLELSEYSNQPTGALRKKESSYKSEIEKYLQPNRLVTISPRIKALAREVTEGYHTDSEKARAIYDYVFTNLIYDKETPGWGRGDTERACDVKRGNCTDFHSLYISLSRASGIPARFKIGVNLPEGKNKLFRSYHCWAEFYALGYGWVPVDISEAWKDRSKYEYHFGTLDQNRIEFSQGRDIILAPSQAGEPLNYFIFPYVEANDKSAADYGIDVEVSFEVEDII